MPIPSIPTHRLMAAGVLALGLSGVVLFAQDAKPADEPAKPGATEPAKMPGDILGKPAAPEPASHVENVITEEIKVGGGKEVKPGASILAHYRGTLKDGGAEFESSYRGNEPVLFALGGVVKGWQEGVPGMKVGGKRKLTIPYAMAYGEKGSPPVIPPKADLVFEIEVLDALNPDEIVKEIKPGDGPPVKMDSIVSLVTRGPDAKPATDEKPTDVFLPREFPGLQTGVFGMKTGGVRRLTIPWKFAFGSMSKTVVPDAGVLTFEVEVKEVKPAPARQ